MSISGASRRGTRPGQPNDTSNSATLAPRCWKKARVHVSRLEKEGKFPKHINLAPQSIGWLEEEILAWIEERAAARSMGNSVEAVASAEARKSENAERYPDEQERKALIGQDVAR